MKSKKDGKNINKTASKSPALKKIKTVGTITEYILATNGLRVLYSERKGTGIVTSNIVYCAGSRDESLGETGIAHMLEHMLFKPTKHDLARKRDSGAMLFERETGIILNANTWKDRTCYYFSYPKEHIDRALQIERERMQDVVLTDKEFLPERTNVLSEFDMYAGNEEFALSVQMVGVALQSHPYGHETIGYREDIEDYTTEKLNRFYEKFYAPNNATLIIVGDVSETKMKEMVLKHFAALSRSETLGERITSREPKQEGERAVVIKRPSTTQMYALGVLHEGFPTKAWFETLVIFDMLAGGADSILHRALIDRGLATAIHTTLEPTYDPNLGILFVTLSKKLTHEKVQALVLKTIHALTTKDITPYLKKTIAKTIAGEIATREHSLGFAQELVEYVSAGSWKSFFDSEKILRGITAKDVHDRMQKLFKTDQITTGHFMGTNGGRN